MKKTKYILFAIFALAISCTPELEEKLPDAPAVPTNLTATSTSDSSVAFEWGASKDAESYNWVLCDRHFNVVDLGKTAGTGVEISNLQKGDKYTFAVRASKGLSISDYSDFIIGIPGGQYIPVQPETPVGLACTSQGETSLTYEWQPSLDAKEYEYILQDDTRAEVRKGTTADTVLLFDGLTKGMIYFMRVKALNDGEESEYSEKAAGIAGGKYETDALRLLFLSAPEGCLWQSGDLVRATVGGVSADFICEDNNVQEGLFWLQEGVKAPSYGNAQVVFPAGLAELPQTISDGYRLPLAAVSQGVQAKMTSLCKNLDLSIVSDVERTAVSFELKSDSAFSGPCSIDWSGESPKLVISGEQGIQLDCSASPKSIGSEPVILSFPVPVKSYASVDAMISTGEETLKAPIEGGVDVSKATEASCIFPNLDDFYSIWRSGNSFTICGQTISKSTHPTANLLQASSINAAFENGGLNFADNSSESRIWTYNSARTKKMCAGTILVGRYKNYPQPTMKQEYATDKQGCFVFDGDVMFLNYRIESKDNSYGAFQGKSGVTKSGVDTFRFQDCTLVNSYNYLISFNNGTYAVPRAIYFDNCIIRVGGTVIYGGSNKSNYPEKLETLSFKNTVIAPYSDTETVSATKANGCLFNFGSTVTATTALNVEMCWCTIYDYQPAIKTRGLIEVKDYADFKMDHTAFYHSSYDGFTGNYYTIYGVAASTMTTGGVTVSTTYSNQIDDVMYHAGGNKSNLAPSPRTWSVSVTKATATIDTDNMNALMDYFPIAAGLNAGAEYQSKYWITH